MIKNKKYLTINTDASFHPIKKTSGYAFYIKCDDFTLKHSGVFKNNIPENSMEAELMCIGNAVYAVLNLKDVPKVDCIIINTDCIPAIHRIMKKKHPLGIKVKSLIDSLKWKCGQANIKIKHVKAHTNKQDSRSWVNDWCDKNAKGQMSKQKKNKL